MNPEIEPCLIQSHATVNELINKSFNKHQETIRQRLQTSVSTIHYSIDLSTSPNEKSFMGICGQWVDSDYRLQKALLSLPEVRFLHSGETMARLLLDTVTTYDVAAKTGYIVADNASSNDTCVQHLQHSLGELGIDFQGRRI